MKFLSEVAFYNAKEPALGSRFAVAVENTTTLALVYPLTGSPASKNTRRVFVKDFPFAIVYRPDADGIVFFCSRPSFEAASILAISSLIPCGEFRFSVRRLLTDRLLRWPFAISTAAALILEW